MNRSDLQLFNPVLHPVQTYDRRLQHHPSLSCNQLNRYRPSSKSRSRPVTQPKAPRISNRRIVVVRCKDSPSIPPLTSNSLMPSCTQARATTDDATESSSRKLFIQRIELSLQVSIPSCIQSKSTMDETTWTACHCDIQASPGSPPDSLAFEGHL